MIRLIKLLFFLFPLTILVILGCKKDPILYDVIEL